MADPIKATTPDALASEGAERALGTNYHLPARLAAGRLDEAVQMFDRAIARSQRPANRLFFQGNRLSVPVRRSPDVLLREAQNIRSIATAPWLFAPGAAVVLAVGGYNARAIAIQEQRNKVIKDAIVVLDKKIAEITTLKQEIEALKANPVTITDDAALAADMAQQLDALNQDRKAIEQGMQREALAQLKDLPLDSLPFGLCLFEPDWHQGVIGIVASRLKERYHRPAIAFADAGDGLLKGSARSVPGLHIRDALDAVAAKHPGLISKFGGHAMAAGLSLPQENYGAFAAAFDAEVRRQLHADDLTGRLLSDGQLSVTEFNLELAKALRHAGPWGQHFPEPLFHGVFQIVQQRLVGEKHLKLVLKTECGGQTLDGIAFNIDRELWPNPTVRWVEVAYKLDVNEFRGNETVQLMIAHLAPR